MKRTSLLITLLALLMVSVAMPVTARQTSDCTLDSVLAPGDHGVATVEIDTHESASPESPTVGALAAGELFYVDEFSEVLCVAGTRWLQVSSMTSYGWIPESANGEFLVEPYVFTPEAPVPFDIPLVDPVISTFDHPLPTVAPAPNPDGIDLSFADWDWDALMSDWYDTAPDPLSLQLPEQYAGDLPTLPVNLSEVHFVQDAALNAQQLALLAQNGFVVVPSSYQQFDDVYRDFSGTWDHQTGKAPFVTTDALLHSLFVIYQNSLMFLESNVFYGEVANFLMQGYQAAEAQYGETIGTHLEAPARKAAVFYAVALMLLADGQDFYVRGYDQIPVYSGDSSPASVIAAADQSIIAEAQPLVDLALAGTGREKVSILEDYDEDFSQYVPRSYYAGSPLLEAYFRTMMWLGRITFTAKSQTDTLTGLMVLRALYTAPDAFASWESVADTLDFLVGPMDDYSPRDYLPIALASYAFREDFSLAAFNDPDTLFYFQFHAAELPPPRINSIPIEQGAITSEELVEQTRGFRLFGQRFTFDGYLMQELIYPAVGTASHSRALPLGLDVPAVLGSDMAYALAEAAGAAEYENYTEHVANLREEINGITANDWLQNLYGGWLWTLQPLAVRNSALTPLMMQTDAWQRKDLTTLLGSYTELKHATLLYAEQPMGGLGGGGMVPPVISYGYIEPQPLVFARIAIVSALLHEGLAERGYLSSEDEYVYGEMNSVGSTLLSLAGMSANLAEMARKEVAGEPLTHDELYYLQENFGNALWYIRYEIEMWITDPPENTAVVADIASNAVAGTVLEIAIGNPDLIYVVTNSPYGLQVTRGAVFSYYEFTQPIDERLTDADWRDILAVSPPPRQDWIDLYFSR